MSTPRRIAVAFLVVLAGLLAGATVYWFHVAGLVGKTLMTWSDARRAAGWQVAYGGPAVGGAPFTITVRLDDPSVTLPNGLGWRAERLTARVGLFDRHHVTLSAPGRQILSFGPLAAAVTAGAAQADLAFDESGRLRQVRVVAASVAVDGSGQPAAGLDTLALSASRLDPAAPLTDQSAVLAFDAGATGLTLPEVPGLALGRRIASLAVAGRVLGPLPSAAPSPDALARWSAGGGTVAIDHLALDWGPMALEADGTVALDPALQPLAAFSARVRGYGQMMDRLATAGVVPPATAQAAKLVLSLMARPDAQGRPAVPVPVTVQNGRLWLGPARLARVPPIPWPPHPASPPQ